MAAIVLSGCSRQEQERTPQHTHQLACSGFSIMVQTEYPPDYATNATVVAVIERKRNERGGHIEVRDVAHGEVPLDFVKEVPLSAASVPFMGSVYGDSDISVKYLVHMIHLAGVTPGIRSDDFETRQAVSDSGMALLIRTLGTDQIERYQQMFFDRKGAVRIPGTQLALGIEGRKYPDLCRLVTEDDEYLYRITLRCEKR